MIGYIEPGKCWIFARAAQKPTVIYDADQHRAAKCRFDTYEAV